MRKLRLLSMLMSVAVVVSLIVVGACTKEGPAGPAGANGQDGEDGIDGKDGNATCGVCHDNSETVETKILQWGASIHATGGNYERNDVGCAPCHTSQGFKEVIVSGAQATAEKVTDPANINCYTCHLIHDTYTVDDWALRSTAQVTLWINGETLPDYGNGNLCMNCHQPRVATIPDVANPEGTYEITSSMKRWGPHHGPQSTVLTGKAFYEVPGDPYFNSHDGVAQGCITCHMADAFGSQAGGHSFNITYDYHGNLEYNLLGCLECHETVEEVEAKMEDWEIEFEEDLDSLATLLIAAGIYDPAGTSGTAVPGTYTNTVAGAYWNFITLEEDRSMGIHNPEYVKALLNNTIASLQ